MAQASAARSAFLTRISTLFSRSSPPARRGASAQDIDLYRQCAEEIRHLLVFHAGVYTSPELHDDLAALADRLRDLLDQAWQRADDPVLTRIFDDYEQVVEQIEQFRAGEIGRNTVEFMLSDSANHMLASVREWSA